MRSPVPILAAVVLALSAAPLVPLAPLAAQKRDRDAACLDSLLAAPRPLLVAGADSNDVEAYLALGFARLRVRQYAHAAVAFLWAARMSPAHATPSMLAHQALWMAVPGGAKKHARGHSGFAVTGVGERVDSLYLRALARDPFTMAVDPQMPPVVLEMVRQDVEKEAARDSNAVEPRLFLAAFHARARQHDAVIARLGEALRALERRQAKEKLPVYHSRELFHFALGQAHAARGDMSAARAAYQQALVDNAGFHPAHARLGWLALDTWADTSTALLEYRVAVDIAPHDPALRNDYGSVLLTLGRHAEAREQFEAGLALAPEYVLFHYNIALAAEQAGDAAAARRHYDGFIRRAPRRLWAQARTARDRMAALPGS